MEIQLRGTGKREHVSQTVAECLIAAGLATQVKPEPAPVKPTEWRVVTTLTGDYSPTVAYKCPNCNQSGFQDSSRGTADQTAVFRHCGIVERCPDEISQKYGDAWEAYAKRHNIRSKEVEKQMNDIRRYAYQKVG